MLEFPQAAGRLQPAGLQPAAAVARVYACAPLRTPGRGRPPPAKRRFDAPVERCCGGILRRAAPRPAKTSRSRPIKMEVTARECGGLRVLAPLARPRGRGVALALREVFGKFRFNTPARSLPQIDRASKSREWPRDRIGARAAPTRPGVSFGSRPGPGRLWEDAETFGGDRQWYGLHEDGLCVHPASFLIARVS